MGSAQWSSCYRVSAAILFLLLVVPAQLSSQQGTGAVRVDNDDIGGVVTGAMDRNRSMGDRRDE